MSDFREILSLFKYPILGVGLLASVSLGIVGSYVVTRRITYIAAAISHCVFGGIGAAYYLEGGPRASPGAIRCFGASGHRPQISAVIIGLVSLYARQREDTVISTVWAIGMAIGLIFFAKTPGYDQRRHGVPLRPGYC